MTFDSTKAAALAEQLERADKTATPKPWGTRYGRFFGDNIYVVESADSRVATTGVVENNAEAIATLRNLTADCAAALREAGKEIERLKSLTIEAADIAERCCHKVINADDRARAQEIRRAVDGK